MRYTLPILFLLLTACAAGQSPAVEAAEREQANSAFVQGLYDAFAEGDVETVLAGLAPDVEWTEAEGFPYGGTYTGRDAVLNEVFVKLGTEWEGYQAVPSEYVAQGDRVIALGTYSGTSKETGKSFQAEFAHVWTIEDGQAQRFRQITDSALVQRALETQ